MTDDATLARADTRYSTVAIVLHWLMAALMVFQVALGFRMEAAQGGARFAAFQLHKSVGITILLLVAARLLWRLLRRPPAITAKPWERALAHVVHALFYVILFALPVSGWIIISTSRIVVPTLLFGAIPWPHVPGLDTLGAAARAGWHDAAESVHVNLVWVVVGLFALHVAGALKHHFVDRDGEIAKMAPGTKAGAWADPRLIAIFAGVVLMGGLGRAWLPIGGTRPAVPAMATGTAPPFVPTAEPIAAAVEPPAAAVDPIANAAEAGNASDAAPPAVSSWTIGPDSALRFHTSWSGDAIDGGFASFGGDIVFDPAALDRSHVDIRVDTGSVFSGDEQRDGTLKSADWFSASEFAAATFKADRFRKTGNDRYVASGTLRIKGVTLPVSLPFTLRITGDKAVMRGTASVDRTAYKIGQGDYAATDEIPAVVSVEVVVNATRK